VAFCSFRNLEGFTIASTIAQTTDAATAEIIPTATWETRSVAAFSPKRENKKNKPIIDVR
jgi:hypothetical protein